MLGLGLCLVGLEGVQAQGHALGINGFPGQVLPYSLFKLIEARLICNQKNQRIAVESRPRSAPVKYFSNRLTGGTIIHLCRVWVGRIEDHQASLALIYHIGATRRANMQAGKVTLPLLLAAQSLPY